MTEFAGYPRDDGRYGVRNHVLVLGLNGLVARAAMRIASGVAGTVLFATPYGRGQFGDDRDVHTAQLVGLGRNPNVAATLVVGADRRVTDDIAHAIAAAGKPVASIALDDVHEDALELSVRGIRTRRRACAQCLAAAPRTRAARSVVPRAWNAATPTQRRDSCRIRSPARSSIASSMPAARRSLARPSNGSAPSICSPGAPRNREIGERDRRCGASARAGRRGDRCRPHRQQSGRRKHPWRTELDRGEIARRDRQGWLAPDRRRAGAWRRRRLRPVST